MSKCVLWIFFLVSMMSLTGCKGATTKITPPPENNTIIPAYTQTSTPKKEISKYPDPSQTPTHIPGPDIRFYYINQGKMIRYNLNKWSEENISIPANGGLLGAEFSSDMQWLVFQDSNGLKLLEKPFITQPVLLARSEDKHYCCDFHFNNQNELAFSDQEGLKIYSTQDKSTTTLFYQNTADYYEDELEYRYYQPIQWSPDGEWLWVGVSYFEGASNILINLPTLVTYDFTACYSNIDWYPSGDAIAATVHYSGYKACGDDDGVYRIELDEKRQNNEVRLHQETSPIDPWNRAPYDIRVNPDGNLIAFIQMSYPDTIKQLSRIILIDSLGMNREVIDSSHGESSSLVWSFEGNTLYYVVYDSVQNLSTIYQYEIDTKHKKVIALIPDRAEIHTIQDDNSWFVVSTLSHVDYELADLYIVSRLSGEIIKVSEFGRDSFNYPLIGVEIIQ